MPPKIILATTRDLFFGTKLRTMANNGGFGDPDARFVLAKDAKDFKQRVEALLTTTDPDDGQLAVAVVDTSLRVAAAQHGPPDLIAFIKERGATLPHPPRILAFGSHLDVLAVLAARKAGADKFVANSKMAASFNDIVARLLNPDTADSVVADESLEEGDEPGA